MSNPDKEKLTKWKEGKERNEYVHSKIGESIETLEKLFSGFNGQEVDRAVHAIESSLKKRLTL